MKNLKKFLSLILSVIMAVSVCIPVYAEDETQPPEKVDHFENLEIESVKEYKAFLLKFSRPAITTEQFVSFMNTVNFITRFFTGRAFYPEEHFDVTVDAFVQDLSNRINEESGVDLVKLATNLPDFCKPAEIIATTFRLDTTAIRNEFYAKSNELYNNGDELMSYLYHFLGAYFSVIDVCEVYSKPVEDKPEVYELMLKLCYKDGTTEDFSPGVFIDTTTGEFTNRDNSGMFGSGFNFSFSKMMTYATVNCWMRNFGFCVFYDIAANSMPLLFNYNTRRFHFDYDGLEWMVQIWKGNYVVANGGEVGLYTRDPENKFATFYNCANDDQMLEMSLQIYAGDKLLVNQEPQLHWWANGFNLSKTMYLPASLTMKFSIEMRDEEMLRAFCESIDNHYIKDVTYAVDGLTVYVVW